jgi:hypothetical protein
MRSCRLLFLPLLAGLTVSLAGALTLQTSNYSPVTAPAPNLPLRADPAAVAALQKAVDSLAPQGVRWLQMKLWQKVDVPPMDFQADGLYRSGPDHRLRLDLQVRSSSGSSHLLIVSDGKTLWQARRLAGATAEVNRLELHKVLEALERPEAAGLRAAFYQEQFFAGLVPLLRNLQQQVTFTHLERTRWKDRDVLLLRGARPGAPGDAWPMHLPRQCRLILDARSQWPWRIEWWGPAPKQAGDVLLSQMEFRDPVLNQPVPEDTFRFDPGTVPVTDRTAQFTQLPQPQ